MFIYPAMKSQFKYIAESIKLAELHEPHIYRFKIQVHAQKKDRNRDESA